MWICHLKLMSRSPRAFLNSKTAMTAATTLSQFCTTVLDTILFYLIVLCTMQLLQQGQKMAGVCCGAIYATAWDPAGMVQPHRSAHVSTVCFAVVSCVVGSCWVCIGSLLVLFAPYFNVLAYMLALWAAEVAMAELIAARLHRCSCLLMRMLAVCACC